MTKTKEWKPSEIDLQFDNASYRMIQAYRLARMKGDLNEHKKSWNVAVELKAMRHWLQEMKKCDWDAELKKMEDEYLAANGFLPPYDDLLPVGR